MSVKNFNDLPVHLQLEVIHRMDTKLKLQLARASKNLRHMIRLAPVPGVWSHVEVTVTSGERTLLFLAEVSPFARSLVANLGSEVLGREGSLPEFPVLTDLDLRSTCLRDETFDSLGDNLTLALLFAFPALQRLRLDGKININQTINQYKLCDLPSVIPVGLTSLTLGPRVKIQSKTISGILSSFPALSHFTLEGCWLVSEFALPLTHEAALQALCGLQKAAVHILDLESGDGHFLDKLAESSVARAVRSLKFSGFNDNFTPTASPHRFSSLCTLELTCLTHSEYALLSNWMGAVCELETLDTLLLRRCCLARPGGRVGFLDEPSGDSLPVQLSTTCLTIFNAEAVHRNVMRCIVRRAATLKNVAIFAELPLSPMGFADLITGLCQESSQIEYLSVESSLGFEGYMTNECQQQVMRVCRHLMAKAHELTHLKFLYFEIGGGRQYKFNRQGCSVAALKGLLPNLECVVRFEDGSQGLRDGFSNEERKFVRDLDGFAKMNLPRMAR